MAFVTLPCPSIWLKWLSAAEVVKGSITYVVAELLEQQEEERVQRSRGGAGKEKSSFHLHTFSTIARQEEHRLEVGQNFLDVNAQAMEALISI